MTNLHHGEPGGSQAHETLNKEAMYEINLARGKLAKRADSIQDGSQGSAKDENPAVLLKQAQGSEQRALTSPVSRALAWVLTIVSVVGGGLLRAYTSCYWKIYRWRTKFLLFALAAAFATIAFLIAKPEQNPVIPPQHSPILPPQHNLPSQDPAQHLSLPYIPTEHAPLPDPSTWHPSILAASIPTKYESLPQLQACLSNSSEEQEASKDEAVSERMTEGLKDARKLGQDLFAQFGREAKRVINHSAWEIRHKSPREEEARAFQASLQAQLDCLDFLVYRGAQLRHICHSMLLANGQLMSNDDATKDAGKSNTRSGANESAESSKRQLACREAVSGIDAIVASYKSSAVRVRAAIIVLDGYCTNRYKKELGRFFWDRVIPAFTRDLAEERMMKEWYAEL